MDVGGKAIVRSAMACPGKSAEFILSGLILFLKHSPVSHIVKWSDQDCKSHVFIVLNLSALL
jgi:hypothetical protein